MALDEALLQAMPRLGRPVLRFYGWIERAASFGYFQKYAEVERLLQLRPLVRRPTGGASSRTMAIGLTSLAFPTSNEWYSLTATESYRRAHEWIRAAFARLDFVTELAPACRKVLAGQCFAGHEKFDVLWRGYKIAGAAQRRTRDGLLIQDRCSPRCDRRESRLADGDVRCRRGPGGCELDGLRTGCGADGTSFGIGRAKIFSSRLQSETVNRERRHPCRRARSTRVTRRQRCRRSQRRPIGSTDKIDACWSPAP